MFFFSCKGGKYPQILKEKQMLCIAIQLDMLWETIYRKYSSEINLPKEGKRLFTAVLIYVHCA